MSDFVGDGQRRGDLPSRSNRHVKLPGVSALRTKGGLGRSLSRSTSIVGRAQPTSQGYTSRYKVFDNPLSTWEEVRSEEVHK